MTTFQEATWFVIGFACGAIFTAGAVVIERLCNLRRQERNRRLGILP